LSVLFEFLDISVETTTRPKAETQSKDGNLVHIYKVEGTLYSPH